jgi:hypothetical protein
MSAHINLRRDRGIMTYLGSIDAVGGEELFALPLAAFSHWHVASYFLLDKLRPHWPAWFERLRAEKKTISLDPNWDPSGAWKGVRELLPLVDVFLPNAAEAMAIARQRSPRAAGRALSASSRRRSAERMAPSFFAMADAGPAGMVRGSRGCRRRDARGMGLTWASSLVARGGACRRAPELRVASTSFMALGGLSRNTEKRRMTPVLSLLDRARRDLRAISATTFIMPRCPGDPARREANQSPVSRKRRPRRSPTSASSRRAPWHCRGPRAGVAAICTSTRERHGSI